MIDLQAIEAILVDETVKGMPGGLRPMPLGDIGRQGWNVLREDLPLPLAVLKESALSHNGHWMRRFLAASRAQISPHGKTTMSPQLFNRQLDDGAFAITIGSVQQLQVARHYGFDRVLMANQLVGRRAIRYVLDEIKRDPAFWLLAGIAAIPAVLIVLTVIGLASVILYNSPLGRVGQFEPESPLWWPIRGLEPLLAPSFVAAVVGVVFMFVRYLGRLLTVGTLGRRLSFLTSRVRRATERLRATPVGMIAPALLLIQLLIFAVSFWHFSDMFNGLDSFINRRPPTDLSPLRPENRTAHNFFTEVMSLQVIVFGYIWYRVLRYRKRRGDHEGLGVAFAGFAVAAFIFLAGQVFPFRILYHNKHERVAYASQRCYLVGQSGSEALIFCPHRELPWNQVVRLDDPALKREGVVESIFAGFDGVQR